MEGDLRLAGGVVMALTDRRDGQSAVGSPRVKGYLGVNSASGHASQLVLVDSAGAEWFIWVDTTGDLRISATDPTSYQADGTIVGSQS